MLFPGSDIVIDHLEDELFLKKQVSVSVLRLDTIHPVVSGNKLFKLHYFLQKAQQDFSEGIISFGGAYSNHLLATAFACREAQIKTVGIVRGAKPLLLSHTLLQCIEYGMQLEFLSREDYSNKEEPCFLSALQNKYPNHLIVPEGGYGPLGAAGAAHIMALPGKGATHICCSTGTATTVAGLVLGAKKSQEIIGFPALKGMIDIDSRISLLINHNYNKPQLKIMDGYHFGGYAKKTNELIAFMNQFFIKHRLPTDFVYTGKMMFGVMDCIKKDLFNKGSNIVCIHTGGLQGNLSLPGSALVF